LSYNQVRSRLSSALGGGGGKALVSAPGRVDFLNTHQDYKGLPVVPVAIRLRCYAMGKKNGTRVVRFASLNLEESSEESRDEFGLDGIKLRGEGWFGDYARGVFASLEGRGHRTSGMDIAVWSEVPIGSGLSSSAALEVSVAKLCSACLGLRMTPREVAEASYAAEHDVMGIPCGRLDQYSSSFGGVISLQTRPPFAVEPLNWPGLAFVIADSGQHRRIASVHGLRQREVEEGLKILMDEAGIPKRLAGKLGYKCDSPMWEEVSEAEVSPFLASLPARLASRILFTLRMQASTSYALRILRRPSPRPPPPPFLGPVLCSRTRDALSVLGAVMDYQHGLLRDLYDVSTPKMEEVRNALVGSGALGAKISGAGLGGVVVGLARNEKAAGTIVETCAGSRIPQMWVSTPVQGARVERPAQP
jgi:galactokinase